MQRERSHLVSITLVAETSDDEQEKIQDTNTDDGQIDGLVSHEITIGKHIVPVHGRRQSDETTRERRQVSGITMSATIISQWSHLQRSSPFCLMRM